MWNKILFLTVSLVTYVSAEAQCAMCRTQVVNNVSAGETSLGESLNFGILYLFFTPYILLGVVAFFWFRMSKKGYRKPDIKKYLGMHS
jgi:hypothetical protein